MKKKCIVVTISVRNISEFKLLAVEFIIFLIIDDFIQKMIIRISSTFERTVS